MDHKVILHCNVCKTEGHNILDGDVWGHRPSEGGSCGTAVRQAVAQDVGRRSIRTVAAKMGVLRRDLAIPRLDQSAAVAEAAHDKVSRRDEIGWTASCVDGRAWASGKVG
ncbi:hypothetical protein E2562_001876 [Oryza meyeriana var. granulata]|uniref:Uncharacterized protein n=1 Tax=Oryza meyeriana var. granulata TaxID=110450 RepID=A0A6G1C359_9ORYZ|nr:hypothetical protein E2562_001876 [Oryza meyeriana var. granulata]